MLILGVRKMNFKGLSIVLLIAITIFLSVGAISAADDDIVALEMPDTDIDTDVVSADVQKVTNTQKVINEDVKKTGEVTNKSKIKTKIGVKPVAVKYKKKGYLTVALEDLYDDDLPIRHAKLNLKIDGKNYVVKTDSYGIAKFNTKNLTVGKHKVVITSADENYDVAKTTSKIFVGKTYKVTLKPNSKKVLKGKDTVSLKIKYDDDEQDVKVVLKKAKSTKILKAKFYLNDRNTGKRIVLTDFTEYDDNKWEWPDEDFSYRYSLIKVKVYYIIH